MGLRREKTLTAFLSVWIQYMSMTDGQTDGTGRCLVQHRTLKNAPHTGQARSIANLQTRPRPIRITTYT